MDENIQELNNTLIKIKELEKKVSLSDMDKRIYKRAKDNVKYYMEMALLNQGAMDVEKYIKVEPSEINVEAICNVLVENKLLFEKQDNGVSLAYSGNKDFPYIILVSITLEDNWLCFKSSANKYSFNIRKKEEVMSFLNEYNKNTRHSKAFIEDDKIVLLRNDYVNFIWDNTDFNAIVMFALTVMTEFFLIHASKLIEFGRPLED